MRRPELGGILRARAFEELAARGAGLSVPGRPLSVTAARPEGTARSGVRGGRGMGLLRAAKIQQSGSDFSSGGKRAR